MNHFPVVFSPLWVSRCTSPFWGSKSSGPFSRVFRQRPRDSISNIFFPDRSLGYLQNPLLFFLYFALFLPWGQARDSIQGPLVSDQLDSIPNLGLNPWLQAKVHKQPLSARQFITFTTRPGPRWAVLPGWTEFRPMGCREGFSIVFETGWELFHVASEYENCIELSVQHHAASHPKEELAAEDMPFSSLFILVHSFLCLICCKSQLRTKPPSRKARCFDLAGGLLLHFNYRSTQTHLFPFQDVENLLSCYTESCFFYLEEWRHVSSTWKNGALNLPSTFT